MIDARSGWLTFGAVGLWVKWLVYRDIRLVDEEVNWWRVRLVSWLRWLLAGRSGWSMSKVNGW